MSEALSQLLDASWRGLPFAVNRSEVHRGRRTALHEYVNRDVVWVEDLGRSTRRYEFSGFVVGPDCYQLESMFLDAAEQPGAGDLVHPSLGSVTATLVDFATAQSKEYGGSVELRFVFIESGDPEYPSSDVSTQDAVNGACDEATVGFGVDFGAVTDSLAQGVSVVQGALSTARQFTGMVTGAVGDASRAFNAVRGLAGVVGGGANFGRYNAGNLINAPLLTLPNGLSSIQRTESAVAGMLSLSTRAVTTVASAAGKFEAVVGSL